MEDSQILLASIDRPNDGETSQCAQDKSQAFRYRCGAQKLVELHRSDYSVNFTPSINHCHWLVKLE